MRRELERTRLTKGSDAQEAGDPFATSNVGLQAIDGPYAAIRDEPGFREVAQRSRLLGFDGKWALHPDQIESCNEIYSPTQLEFDRGLDIIERRLDATIEAATAAGRLA